jgi:hypothetical protein
MVRGGSLGASRVARGGFAVLSLAVLAVGAVLLFRDGRAPAGRQQASTRQPDQDLAAYGARIKVSSSVLATAREFITAAVSRRDLERGWQLAAPALKAGVSKREWLAGTMPVAPSPPEAFRRTAFGVVRARERDVLLLVNDEFFIELVPRDGRWLVSYWAQRGHTGPVPAVP